MSTEPTGGSYLVELLRQYCALVLTHKKEIEDRLAAQLRLADRGEVMEISPDAEIAERAEALQRQLRDRLEEQAQDVLRRGDEREQRRFREMQYVMVAFTDEVFLSLSWEGQEYWSDHLLEERLFATHHAGTKFFANIDELLRQRDATRADVAVAFLLALSLGFRGRYHGASGDAEIERYRQQLFAFLFQRNLGLNDEAQLYGQAYAQLLTGKPQSWLPILRPWFMAIAAVLGLYVLMSHAVWVLESSRISRIIDDLRESPRTAGAKATTGPAS